MIYLIFSLLLSSSFADKDFLDQFIQKSQLTPISLPQARNLFLRAIKNPEIRMKSPNGPDGGKCGEREEKMHEWLNQSEGLSTGSIGIGCPSNNIIGKDRSTGKVFKYANYHMANLVLVSDQKNSGLYVMDAQFTDGPMKLKTYLQYVIHGRSYRHFSNSRDKTMPTDISEPCMWFVSSDTLSSADLDR